jgi:hypothetical protein
MSLSGARGATAGYALCLRGLVSAAVLAHGAAAAQGSPESVSALWRKAEQVVGVPIVLPSTPQLPTHPQDLIRFRPLGPGEASSTAGHLRLYTAEFSKYPRSLLRAVNLEWVAFVKGLRVADDPRAATYVRFFGAGDMKPAGGMVYDVQQGAYDERYVRWVLHHEFFHFIDSSLNRGLEDRAWSRLNPEAFRYTGMTERAPVLLEHPRAGAITRYAMKSMPEDRAEVFAALFVDEAHPRLRQIAQADPVVRGKVRLMMQLLRRIDPSMNDRYFRTRLGEHWRALADAAS